MTTSQSIDDAKDQLVDSLSTARDVTRAAIIDDIAPAVAAAAIAARDAALAAREASGPAYADAAGRASDAVSAVRNSAVAASLVPALIPKRRRRGTKRLTFLAVALGAGSVIVIRRRRSSAGDVSPIGAPTDQPPG